MESFKSQLMDEAAVSRAVKRISHEILEKNGGADNLYIIGIKRRGVPLADMIAEYINKFEGVNVPVGSIDITLYRDDLSEISAYPVVNESEMEISVAGKRIILVDDVLYTGRTVRAALEAIVKLGRPECVQLAVLVDRGHREFPIKGDYVGKNIPTAKTETVAVSIPPVDEKLCVDLFEKKD